MRWRDSKGERNVEKKNLKTRVKVNERKRQDEKSWVDKKAEKTQKYKIRKR